MARSGAIEIPVAVDTGGVEKSINNGLIDPIEDAEKALKKLGDTDAGRDIDKAMDKAQDATQDLSKELDRTRKDLDKLGFAAKDAGSEGKAGLGRIKDGAQEVTQEIGSNLGEAVSSIRGDMSDLGQVGQDTLGGLAATLASAGPAGIVGAAALAAGAVGLGLVTAELGAQQEEADKLKERLSDAYTTAAEDGRDYLDVVALVANAQDLINNTDRAEEWNKIQQTQKETGLEMTTILKANAGDLDALAIVQGRVRDVNLESAAAGDEVNLVQAVTGDNLQQLVGHWDAAGAAAQDSHDRASDSIKFTTQLLQDEIAAAQDVTVSVDDLGNSLYTLPDGKEILIDAKTGQATTDVSKFKDDADGVIDHLNGRDIVFKATLDDSNIRNYKPPTLHIPGRVVARGSVEWQ